MLKFIKNKKGIMGLTLSQIGILIATAILITSVFSLIFLNDWNKEAELRNIASYFSAIVEGMDARFFENTTRYYFSHSQYDYSVSISTEYLVISAQGNWNNQISIKEQFLIKIWPQSTNDPWLGKSGLHEYLKTQYGNFGNYSDPIKNENIDAVETELNNMWEIKAKELANNPIKLDLKKPIYIDKSLIYIENGEKLDYLFVYQ